MFCRYMEKINLIVNPAEPMVGGCDCYGIILDPVGCLKWSIIKPKAMLSLQ